MNTIGLTEILWVLELGHHEQLVTTKRTCGLNHSNYYSRLVSITETMLTLPLAVSAATWSLPSRISSLPLNSGSQNFNGSTSHLYPGIKDGHYSAFQGC